MSSFALSVVVQAHPKRKAWAEAIAEATGAMIVWDEIGNVWDTRRRALLAGTGSHVMCLQDDSVLSEGLVESVSRAIEYSQDNPVSLYATAGQLARAALNLNPSAWWTAPGPIWGVALVIPMSHIPQLVKDCDRMRYAQDDKRITHWYSGRCPTWYTVPSLVDHRDEGSLTGPTRLPRKAERFGSGLNVDWSAPPLETTRDGLYPIVQLRNGTRVGRARRYTAGYRRLVAQGFKEEAPH